MNYAIEVLIKERDVLESCLTKWESSEYPEAKKLREYRLNSLNKAIRKLTKPRGEASITSQH